MLTYCFRCPECGTTGETRRPPEDYHKPFKCPECKAEMVRDFGAEKVNSGNRDYRKPIVSDSLAINPEQIPEHQQRFPDIKVLPDGRPVFDSFQTHEKYLQDTGFVKSPQRRRRRFTSKIGGKGHGKKKKAKV